MQIINIYQKKKKKSLLKNFPIIIQKLVTSTSTY